MTNPAKYQSDLASLLQSGESLINKLGTKETEEGSKYFSSNYQLWYTEALAVVKQLIPDRLEEFIELYSGNPHRHEITPYTYTIQDWLRGNRVIPDAETGQKHFDDYAVVVMRFINQKNILASAEKRWAISLLDWK